VTENPQTPEESIDSDDIKDIQQDEGLTPADRVDLISNAIEEDEGSADATEDESGNS
jgi:hypothetical protein